MREPLGSDFALLPRAPLLLSFQDDGIVVAEVRWDGHMAEPVRWPFALRQHVGDDGVAALLAAQKEWKEEVLTTATDRFEWRLAEECALLRQDFAASRTEMLRWSFVFWIGQVASIAALFFARG